MARYNPEIPYMLHFGIDVSRDKLDCAVVDDYGQCVNRARTFKNDAEGVIEFIHWAREITVDQPGSIVMEATAAYHELAATRIHSAGLVISVVNPAQVRALAKGLGMLRKTDLIDALLLAHYSRLARPRQWYPTESTLRDFSAMLTRLDCLEADLSRKRNRREQAAVRSSAECVLSSIDACIEFLQGHCEAMRKTIASHIVASDLLSQSVARLRKIPAVGEKTAMRMAAILAANSFRSAKEAAAYLGLVPIIDIFVRHDNGFCARALYL